MFIFNVAWPNYIKLWWQKKIILLQMRNTDLQLINPINLEKME